MKVAVTRPAHQSEDLVAALEAIDLDVVLVPLIQIGPPNDGGKALAESLAQLGSFDWVVFTSANAVDVFFDAVPEGELPSIATVGEATSIAVEGFGAPVAQNGRSTAEELAQQFPPGSGFILFPSSASARPVLPRALENKGWKVTTVAAYKTEPRPLSDHERSVLGECDLAVLASPSATEALAAAVEPSSLAVVTIGPTTTEAARALGFEVVAEAVDQSDAGLVAAVGSVVSTA